MLRPLTQAMLLERGPAVVLGGLHLLENFGVLLLFTEQVFGLLHLVLHAVQALGLLSSAALGSQVGLLDSEQLLLDGLAVQRILAEDLDLHLAALHTNDHVQLAQEGLHALVCALVE